MVGDVENINDQIGTGPLEWAVNLYAGGIWHDNVGTDDYGEPGENKIVTLKLD